MPVNISDHLFHIGLLPKSSLVVNKKRHAIYSPKFMFFIIFIYHVKCLFILNTRDKQVLAMLGDATHHFNMRNHYNILVYLLSGAHLLCQLIYFRNTARGIEPTFLKIFTIMSKAEVTPSSLGLTKEQDVNKVKILCINLFKIIYVNDTYLVPIVGFTFVFTGFLAFENFFNIIIYGLFHSLYFSLSVHYVWNILGYQCIYFFILCKYIKMKFKNLNDNIR